ncbi:hypothetical protein Pflav_032120 [Phytohabitans flavus]|uniref:Major facilitator superfamily (MFS) profile domain-containing protein n=1 Tax=Phytohabitans flavus TaxID=1076124 RepID=A0A6F8XSH4_9ACTN|nr:hypothetical protein Pflav_032120 [Phytohabitans flavus]
MPGMAPLLGVSLLARTAITADVMALTLYIVLGLDLSYAAAGGVAAALTAGVALGGPLLGRMIDRRGLRTVVLATVVVQVVFWLSVPILPYGVLLGAAFAAGLLMVPAQSVTRQAIAAMTTAEQRRPAFALESVQGELSYIVGPGIVILCAAATSPEVVAWGWVPRSWPVAPGSRCSTRRFAPRTRWLPARRDGPRAGSGWASA